MPDSAKESFMEAVNEQSPKVDEDTMPGELANVVSGRVANLLDLQGPNHAMDAACASSMAAVMDACRLLQTRQADVMLAGATDRTMDPATYAKFSAIGGTLTNTFHTVRCSSKWIRNGRRCWSNGTQALIRCNF